MAIPMFSLMICFFKHLWRLNSQDLKLLLEFPVPFFCAWYAAQKHWLANNILGLTFCIAFRYVYSLRGKHIGSRFLHSGMFTAARYVYNCWNFLTSFDTCKILSFLVRVDWYIHYPFWPVSLVF